MTLHVTSHERPRRENRLVETIIPVAMVLLGVLGAVVLPILVSATVLAASEPLPMVVRLGLVFVAVAVGAFLSSLLGDAPFSHTFGRWYEGR